MTRQQRENNLARVCDDLTRHCASSLNLAQLPPPAPLAEALLLAHSTSSGGLAGIQRSGFLQSAAAVYALKGMPVPPDSAESVLGTSGFVFLYTGTFRYPRTSCGLLFAKSLEAQHKDDGEASPFDSGGLLCHLQRPDPAELPRSYLQRHSLPLPGHRDYLGQCLSTLFAAPEDYLKGGPIHSGPLGLTGGDARRWTHEVRIPECVQLRGPHLQAVFVPVSFAGPNSAIAPLLSWCLAEQVDVVAYQTDDFENFETLNRTCRDYLLTNYNKVES